MVIYLHLGSSFHFTRSPLHSEDGYMHKNMWVGCFAGCKSTPADILSLSVLINQLVPNGACSLVWVYVCLDERLKNVKRLNAKKLKNWTFFSFILFRVTSFCWENGTILMLPLTNETLFCWVDASVSPSELFESTLSSDGRGKLNCSSQQPTASALNSHYLQSRSRIDRGVGTVEAMMQGE